MIIYNEVINYQISINTLVCLLINYACGVPASPVRTVVRVVDALASTIIVFNRKTIIYLKKYKLKKYKLKKYKLKKI